MGKRSKWLKSSTKYFW